MHTYELMNTMVAGRRADLESDAITARLARRRPTRSWFRRSSAAVETARSDITLIARTVPAPGTADFHLWAAAVGYQLDHAGVNSVESHLRALARRARQLGVATVLAGVLTDRHAPEVVRARAFARIAGALGSFTTTSDIARAAAA